MRIHVLQHVAFENEGGLRRWAALRGHTLTRTRLFASDPFPSQRGFDALVVTGGPMNVYEYDRFPWLMHEKTFILDAIESEVRKPVLGLCLGAQLIADVLGARVRPNVHREIGWFPVSLMPAARPMELFRHFPPEFVAFHWHGDTFTLPAGAVHLAGSKACANQAFVMKNRILGLQFHLEYTRRNLQAMIRNAGDELVPGRFVQGADELLADPARIKGAQALLFGLLDAWIATGNAP
jgi:GMP synthase (glutamine-hydrolysing)